MMPTTIAMTDVQRQRLMEQHPLPPGEIWIDQNGDTAFADGVPAAAIAAAQAIAAAGDGEAQKLALMDYAASVRWQHEIGGTAIDLGGGIVAPIPTDREGRSALKQARDMLKDGELLDADGNVRTAADVVIGSFGASLDEAAMTAMLKRSAQHVQACFATQKAVMDDIESGTITTEAEIDAAFAT
jgi:hypothetical protein